MKKSNLLVTFIGVVLVLIFGLFLYDLGQEVVRKMGETWTSTHTSMVLLAFLALVSAIGLHFSGGINMGGKGQSGQPSGGYKMIEGTASQPYGLLPGPTEQEVLPQYNDTYFGETVDL